jgi:hypothetical protein
VSVTVVVAGVVEVVSVLVVDAVVEAPGAGVVATTLSSSCLHAARLVQSARALAANSSLGCVIGFSMRTGNATRASPACYCPPGAIRMPANRLLTNVAE